jgi:hypothetical protein
MHAPPRLNTDTFSKVRDRLLLLSSSEVMEDIGFFSDQNASKSLLVHFVISGAHAQNHPEIQEFRIYTVHSMHQDCHESQFPAYIPVESDVPRTDKASLPRPSLWPTIGPRPVPHTFPQHH